MKVPSYQIRNILDVYSKQLIRAQSYLNCNRNITISDEGKRTVIIEKVALSIIDKITSSVLKKEPISVLQPSKKDTFTKRKTEKFVFTSIDTCNNKTNQTLSVENPYFILNSIIQLTRQSNNVSKPLDI